METLTCTVGSLSDYDVEVLLSSLTRPGSEFQQELRARNGSTTPIALVRDGSWRIVSWAATHRWRGLQTLEGFTLPVYRRRGCSRAAVATLAANGDVSPTETTAIFSPLLYGVATSIGCRDIQIFEFRDGDWRRNS
jgi:hypothetical protein